MSEPRREDDGIRIEHDAAARMRDGTILRADVYRPEGAGPWPTLLMRTPYDKRSPFNALLIDPLRAARAGFMVVLQDTRGRLASEGEWLPFAHERGDGHDTVEWAARLPGSNGRVGMFGDSYLGSTQWMAAIEQPPSLAAISPALTWRDPLDGLLARGGALELGLALPWDLETGAGHIAKHAGSAEEGGRRVEAVLDDYDQLSERGYWDLPVHDAPLLRRHRVPDLGTISMLGDPGVAEWSQVEGFHQRVQVPTFHTAAWPDIFLQGSLDNFQAMAALGRPARLVVGPWHHGPPFVEPFGERHFGLRGNRLGVPAHPRGDVVDEQLAWFRSQLDPEAPPESDEAPVRIFVMGRNRWREERQWPLARARAERWYLGSDGGLSTTAPGSGRASEFTYDPRNPVPTHGGNLVMAPTYPPGPFDQTAIEARPDVLVFTSEPLDRELEVTGRVKVVLHAASDAPSTDWVARLCDVGPDGRSFNLCDGISRVAKGADALQRIEIDLWSTSNAFLPGHRLRVHVTSSNFPRWDRNLNTGDQRSPQLRSARQLVHHDADHASWIELPVVPPYEGGG
jgi:putative CocE/NonD family hydrolase